jgi:hypothetical protein
MVHDTPLLHYVAFLLDRFDYVVYRDVFETSMPGTILFHLAIGKLFGYGDLAFRLVDLAWLGSLLAVTWHLMRRFGRRVAWASVVLFGLSYFQHGQNMSLQRDYLAVLPISMAVLLAASRRPWRSPTIQLCLIGLLFGLAATIKPHLAIGLPLVLLFYWRHPDQIFTTVPPVSPWLIGAFALVGFFIPVAGAVLWVCSQGAWLYFWEMISQYLSLHLQLTRTHETIFGIDRLRYLIHSHQELGGRSIWLTPACLGVYMAVFEAQLSHKKTSLIYLLIGLAILYSLYPILAGQFFNYHWMPFQYFIVILAALAAIRLPQPSPSPFKRLFPILLLGVTLYLGLNLPEGFLGQLEGLAPPPPKYGRVDEIASFLQSRLEPGDLVQPLDWTGGAVHAMLLARAKAATPFIYDYHFYHHISHPYIQLLRQRFIQQLTQTKPRFVVAILTDKPWVSGADTSREFKELNDFLTSHYTSSVRNDGYIIYERTR